MAIVSTRDAHSVNSECTVEVTALDNWLYQDDIGRRKLWLTIERKSSCILHGKLRR